ncbi:MAG: lactonase family protein [Acidobacteriaceae bacterium]
MNLTTLADDAGATALHTAPRTAHAALLEPTTRRAPARSLFPAPFRLASLPACLVLLAALAGCGKFFVPVTTTPGGGGTTGTGDYVYVANGSTNTIVGYSIAKATGALTTTPGSPYTVGISPTALAITANNSFLFVGGYGGLYEYSISSTGALTALNGGSALASVLAQSMTISPDGQWLFILNSDAATLSQFQINQTTGALTQATGTSFSVGGSSQAVKISPNGQYIFIAMGTGGTLVYGFNTSTGGMSISPLRLVPQTLISDNALAVDANSAYLYIARSGSTGSGVAAYSIASGGALTAVAGSPTATGVGPYSILLNSTGAYLYVGNRTDGTISEYSVGSGGVLTALASSPVKAVGTLPVAMARDKSGSYIAVVNNGGSPDLNILAISGSSPGTLASVATASTGTDPTNPTAIVATH